MKKQPITPVSIMKNHFRTLWLRSREKNHKLKLEHHTCYKCHRKASTAKGFEFKVQVHHKRAPNWDRIIQVLREELLVGPEELEVLCAGCHDPEHAHDEHRFMKKGERKPVTIDVEAEPEF